MERRALLIFADSAHTDCKRRGWPSAFRILLETQSFNFQGKPAFDLHLFTSCSSYRPLMSSMQVHFQEGGSFGQKLENAIESLARLGYQEIVIVGRDCPDLEQRDIFQAFQLLNQHGLVLGPDHRGGCYLIGIHASDREKLRGIRWQQNTDFQEIHRRFECGATVDLPVKLDLDTLEDVRLLAASVSPFRLVARALLDATSPQLTVDVSYPQCSREERIHWQLPPPVGSSPFQIV